LVKAREKVEGDMDFFLKAAREIHLAGNRRQDGQSTAKAIWCICELLKFMNCRPEEVLFRDADYRKPADDFTELLSTQNVTWLEAFPP
jgi:hypothetical protein